MNRFEALHALGLEEGSSDDDVTMALYGIEKASKRYDFSDVEPLQRRVERSVQTARDAKKFMFNAHNRASAKQVLSFKEKPREKLRVTALESRRALLSGTEFVRRQVCIYLGTQQDNRRNSILALVLCVVVGFILLRYVRVLVARMTMFGVLAVAAVIGSTVLTRSILTIRKVKAHLVEIDDDIAAYRHDLGLDDDDKAAEEEDEVQSQALIADSSTVEDDVLESSEQNLDPTVQLGHHDEKEEAR